MYRTIHRIKGISKMSYRPLLLIVISLATLGVLFAAPVLQAAEKYAVEIKEDVVYGTGGGEELTLHLARPTDTDQAAPALVFIHGGGWRTGNKNSFRPAIELAAQRGYVAVTVGYRFAPKHRFPAQIEDCKCAVRWLRAHAEELNVDPHRIGAIGGSAGAHLALLLGTMDSGDGLEGNGGWDDQTSKVQAVVSYFGPVNLTLSIEDIQKSPAAEVFMEQAVRAILRDFVGGELEERTNELQLASPINYVNEGDAPMLLFQGTRDPLVPFDQTFEMAGALTTHKIPGRVEFIIGAGHGWRGGELDRTEAAVMAFFDKHLENGK
jgi:acetyl esterase/lipase